MEIINVIESLSEKELLTGILAVLNHESKQEEEDEVQSFKKQ